MLRGVLETGTTPDLEGWIPGAAALVTSRLSLVEASRALLRLRPTARVPEEGLGDAGRAIDILWTRCEIWELTPAVCALAGQVARIEAARAV